MSTPDKLSKNCTSLSLVPTPAMFQQHTFSVLPDVDIILSDTALLASKEPANRSGGCISCVVSSHNNAKRFTDNMASCFACTGVWSETTDWESAQGTGLQQLAHIATASCERNENLQMMHSQRHGPRGPSRQFFPPPLAPVAAPPPMLQLLLLLLRAVTRAWLTCSTIVRGLLVRPASCGFCCWVDGVPAGPSAWRLFLGVGT